MNFMNVSPRLKLPLKFPSQPLLGAAPPRPPEASTSPPGTNPGKSCLPAELRGPSYTFLSAAICAPVKQDGSSRPGAHLLRSLAGSKEHFRGFSINPSFEPSSASHLS